MVVEGFLNVSWGVRRPIRLKIQDDKQALPFAPLTPADLVSPVSPISPISPLEDKRFCAAFLYYRFYRLPKTSTQKGVL